MIFKWKPSRLLTFFLPPKVKINQINIVKVIFLKRFFGVEDWNVEH